MSLFATLMNLGSATTVAESTSEGAWYESFFPVAHNEVREDTTVRQRCTDSAVSQRA